MAVNDDPDIARQPSRVSPLSAQSSIPVSTGGHAQSANRFYPPDQWKSIRTTNAIERLHEEFKRRIKTQTVLPSADTAALLFWALLASGQVRMRKVDGWPSLAKPLVDQPVAPAA